MANVYKGEHIAAYEAAYGPVPKGFQVHHKDHDKTNNHPSNLVALTPKEHWDLHHKERGADWHAKGGRASWESRPDNDLTCYVCKKRFTSKVPSTRCCSESCRKKHWKANRQAGG